MSVKDCIFVTESCAHLNEQEKELLPKVEAARAEHEHLLQAKASHDLWLEKTDWILDDLPAKYLGYHRADVMRMEIERLRNENEALLQAVRDN